jgi:hypothetical protein
MFNNYNSYEEDFIAFSGQCVQRGEALLNSLVPGWFYEIAPYDIDMLDNQKCVLGQVYSNIDLREQFAKDYGFILDSYSREIDGYDFFRDYVFPTLKLEENMVYYGFEINPNDLYGTKMLRQQSAAYQVLSQAWFRVVEGLIVSN